MARSSRRFAWKAHDGLGHTWRAGTSSCLMPVLFDTGHLRKESKGDVLTSLLAGYIQAYNKPYMISRSLFFRAAFSAANSWGLEDHLERPSRARRTCLSFLIWSHVEGACLPSQIGHRPVAGGFVVGAAENDALGVLIPEPFDLDMTRSTVSRLEVGGGLPPFMPPCGVPLPGYGRWPSGAL